MANRCEPRVWLTLMLAGLVLLAVRPDASGSYQWALGVGALFGAAAAFALIRVPSRQRETAVPGSASEIVAATAPAALDLTPLGAAPPDIGSLDEIRARGSAGRYRYTPVPIRLDADNEEDDLRQAA